MVRISSISKISWWIQQLYYIFYLAHCHQRGSAGTVRIPGKSENRGPARGIKRFFARSLIRSKLAVILFGVENLETIFFKVAHHPVALEMSGDIRIPEQVFQGYQ